MSETDQPHSEAEIIERIDALVAEAHELERAAPGGLDAVASARMREIEVERDRLWDLRRARRARTEAGQDPDQVRERSGDVVENYQQ